MHGPSWEGKGCLDNSVHRESNPCAIRAPRDAPLERVRLFWRRRAGSTTANARRRARRARTSPATTPRVSAEFVGHRGESYGLDGRRARLDTPRPRPAPSGPRDADMRRHRAGAAPRSVMVRRAFRGYERKSCAGVETRLVLFSPWMDKTVHRIPGRPGPHRDGSTCSKWLAAMGFGLRADQSIDGERLWSWSCSWRRS